MFVVGLSKALSRRLAEYEIDLPPSIDHSSSNVNHAASTVHYLSYHVTYEIFTNYNKAYLSSISSQYEIEYVFHAVKSAYWRDATKKENPCS